MKPLDFEDRRSNERPFDNFSAECLEHEQELAVEEVLYQRQGNVSGGARRRIEEHLEMRRLRALLRETNCDDDIDDIY